MSRSTVLGGLAALLCLPGRADAAVDRVPLADGTTTPRLWLTNGCLSVSFLPELGGKIASLRDAAGRERLSRSSRPYVRRAAGMAYGDGEFDGIDEIFPSLTACACPAGATPGAIRIPDHGELWQSPWQVASNAPGVTLACDSATLGCRVRRQATLEGDTLVLDYAVTNRAATTLSFLYTFHPLFAVRPGCRLSIADDARVTVSWSKGGWLGRNGAERRWGEIRDGAGDPFREALFVPGSGRYYKFFSPRLDDGRCRLTEGDGAALEVAWPAAMLPRYAIWCSEGGVGDLHHLAIEPTTGLAESLDAAVKAAEALVIPAGGALQWRITVRAIAAPKR